MLRLLFTRRWLGALLAAVVFAVGAWFLGGWQWGRHEAKVHRNDLLTQHYEAPPVPLRRILAGDEPLRGADDWTRVTAVGTYAADEPLLVRNRVHDSAGGYEAVYALRLDGGGTLLVDRGWVRTSDRGAAVRPALPPTPAGEVTVTGWLRPSEPSLGRKARAGELASINLREASAGLGTPLLGAYLNLQHETLASGAVPPRPVPLEAPDRDLGPHQAYAYQWWAGMSAGFILIWLGLRREVKEREALDPTRPVKPKKVRIWDEEDG